MPALSVEKRKNIADLLYLKIWKKETRERAVLVGAEHPVPSHQIQLYSSTHISTTIAFLNFIRVGRVN